MCVLPCMDDSQRETYLTEITGDGATVGASIPDEIVVDGEEVNVKQKIFDEECDADSLVVKLRRRKNSIKQQVSNDSDLTEEEASELVDKAIGIQRAIEMLQDSDESISAEAQQNEVKDQHRWKNFVDNVSTELDN